jgi:hypothetical protein
MKINKCTWFTAALAAVLVTVTAPAFAQGSYVDPFTEAFVAGRQVEGEGLTVIAR